jgi:hypothetical protein
MHHTVPNNRKANNGTSELHISWIIQDPDTASWIIIPQKKKKYCSCQRITTKNDQKLRNLYFLGDRLTQQSDLSIRTRKKKNEQPSRAEIQPHANRANIRASAGNKTIVSTVVG